MSCVNTDQPSPSPSETDDQAFQRLARLSPAGYDRARRAEAKSLRIRTETLDSQVAQCRSQLALEDQANAVHLPAIVPWPDPVDGAEVLTQVSSRFSLQVVLPPGAADALALWTAHTHAFTAFHQSPRLNLHSPHGGCGKTTTLDILTTMTPRPLRAESLSAAVLFRLVDQHQPTLLLDEVDAYLHQAEELRGLLNAGHKRGACAYRCEGEGNAVRAFNAFAPAALAGIGVLPATLHDRSILVPLVPAHPGEITIRFDPLHTETEDILARKLARWASDNFAALAACDPPLPPGAFNRLADNWRPLLAIACIADGEWPRRALDAFAKLTPKPLSRRSQTEADQLLLSDLRGIFAQAGADRLFSRTLVQSLQALPNRPWSGNHNGDKPLSEFRLARRLAAFGIRSQTLRIGSARACGYLLSAFLQPSTNPVMSPSHDS